MGSSENVDSIFESTQFYSKRLVAFVFISMQ